MAVYARIDRTQSSVKTLTKTTRERIARGRARVELTRPHLSQRPSDEPRLAFGIDRLLHVCDASRELLERQNKETRVSTWD